MYSLSMGSGSGACQNPLSGLMMCYDDLDFWVIPGYQQGVRCKARHRRSRCCVREERRLRRINNASQREATEGNTADDSLMVNQGP